MERQRPPEPATAVAGQPRSTARLLEDDDYEAPDDGAVLENEDGGLPATTGNIRKSSPLALGGSRSRIPLKQTELLSAPTFTGTRQTIQTAQTPPSTQPPTPKRENTALPGGSKSHSPQAARHRSLSASSLRKPSSMPSMVGVKIRPKPSTGPKQSKSNSRLTSSSSYSLPGPRSSTTPIGPRPSTTQHGRGATPSSKTPVPPRATSNTETRRQSLSAIPVALGSPIALLSSGVLKTEPRPRPASLLAVPSSGPRTWQTDSKAPSPAPTPTLTKTKRLPAQLETREVGSASTVGNPTNGTLPPTRSPTPRQPVRASATQSAIPARSSPVQDAVKTKDKQGTSSSRPSTIQATSRQLGTASTETLVNQEGSGRLAKQTTVTAPGGAPGGISERLPTPTTPSRRSSTHEVTLRPERVSGHSVSTRTLANSAASQTTATSSGRLSTAQESQDTRIAKDPDRGCSSHYPLLSAKSRSLTRTQGKQLQMQIPSRNHAAHACLPATPVSATSTASSKLVSASTSASRRCSSCASVTQGGSRDSVKLSPTPPSLAASNRPPTTPAAVPTVLTLPPTPASPKCPLKPPGSPALFTEALFQSISSPHCVDVNLKHPAEIQGLSTTRIISPPIPTPAVEKESQSRQGESSAGKTSPSCSEGRQSPSDLRAPPDTPTVRVPANDVGTEAADKPAVPFHPFASGGLFICGNEPRIQKQESPKLPRFVGYAPPVRILRSPERAPVPLEYPPWDRTVEVTWERTLNNPADKFIFDKELSFQQGVLRLRRERASRDPDGTHTLNHTGLQNGRYPQLKGLARSNRCLYFLLPDRARFKITNMILNDHNTGNLNPKPVRMNPPHCYEPIWPLNPLDGRKLWTTECLDSFASAISPLYPYMSVCYDMRVDFLAAFFLARRFHVVYSPFVAEKNCPTATLLMDSFVPLMRYITLEVDYTKLGGNVHPTAVGVDQWRGLQRVRQLVLRFADLQCTRADGVNIGNLCLMVRRYYGFREGMKWKKGSAERRVRHDEPETEEESSGWSDTSHASDETTENDDEEFVPYHPDAYLCILDPLKTIGHHIDSLTIVGTTRSYANELIYAVWGQDEIPRGPGWKTRIEKHRKYRTAATFPFTPGQRSALTRSGRLQITRHTRDPRCWVGSYGCRLRPEVKLAESKLVPGKTKYGFQWNEEVRPGPPGGVLTIVKLPADEHLTKVVMKPAKSPQRFTSTILSKVFNRTPKGIRPPLSAPSSPGLNTTPTSTVAPASGPVSPSITKPSPLSQITYLGEESNDEGRHKLRQSSPNSDAQHMEDDGDDHWKRHFWKPSKIPLGTLIKRHAKSITKKISSNKLGEINSEHDSHSGGGSEDQKGTFGKLMKRASSNVLRKGFFGKRGIQTHRY
ncbi:uncharacterized protein QC763_511660 [Podospora pseudopauciseta]|uniref:Alpha-ketoglutarate-dependent dioxygenase AlkB-like domain-containing protein n=1 Tax=Podospora pseudopauciseta TaxID=2093780 RepID=A0ABR0HAJ1_9PEZI|nr:hypothetical protein QC763_511660 [Podospora pseudopauciseta]